MLWKKIFCAAFFMTILSFSSVQAEIRVYEGYGEHFMNDAETVDFAKGRAELEAQRDALEQVGFYVKSQSEVQNFSLKNDEIIIIATGILHVIDTKFSIEKDDGEIVVKSFVTAQIDIDELEKLLEQAIKSRASDD